MGTPCNVTDGQIPVLEVKVNVNDKEDNTIYFEPQSYLHRLCSQLVSKWTILTQEGLGRIINTKIARLRPAALAIDGTALH